MKKIISLIAFLLALGIVLALSSYGNNRSLSSAKYSNTLQEAKK